MQPQIGTKVSQRSKKCKRERLKTELYPCIHKIYIMFRSNSLYSAMVIDISWSRKCNFCGIVTNIFYAVIKINANGENKFVAHSQIIIMMLTNKNWTAAFFWVGVYYNAKLYRRIIIKSTHSKCEGFDI